MNIRKQLARTYAGERDPWERVQEYHRTMEYASYHPDKGSSAVSNALNLPRSRIRPWLDGSKPDPVHAIQTAESIGWLEIEYSSSIFAGLNVLVASIFSAGSIRTDAFVPSITVDTNNDLERLQCAFQLVGVDHDTVHSSTSNRAIEIRPTEHASVLGRVLVALGAPAGDKNRASDLSLPEYLNDAPLGIRLDFASTYVRNRATPTTDRPNHPLVIREERSASYTEELRAFFSSIVGDRDYIRGGRGSATTYITPEAAEILDTEPTFGL